MRGFFGDVIGCLLTGLVSVGLALWALLWSPLIITMWLIDVFRGGRR